MSRFSVVGALFAALIVGVGCEDNNGEEVVEVVRSGLGGFGGGNVETVGSPIRGYTAWVSGVETHAAVFRNPGTGLNVVRRTGTPLGTAATDLGGTMWVDGAPWGYVRADSVDVVLYIAANRHVHEIRRSGSSNIDLDYCLSPINAPLAHGGVQNGPLPDVIGYVRAGLRSAVIYRGADDHVIELLQVPGGNPSWLVSDLTALSGTQALVSKGSPFPYARSDGYNTIVYAANDAQIHELSTFATPGSGTGAWSDGSLSAASGSIIGGDPSTDPWGYRRSDSINAVVYVGEDGQMHELALFGGAWHHGILPAISPRQGLHGRPSGYARGDGINTVVYAGNNDAAIHELALQSGAWSDTVIATPGVIQPSQVFAHRPTQDRGSILFRGLLNGFAHGFELRLPSTTTWTMQQF